VKLIAKHLPLLALALLVSSTQLRAEELPFKVGDDIVFYFNFYVEKNASVVPSDVEGERIAIRIKGIKGKWVSDGYKWFNSDLMYKVEIPRDNWPKNTQ